MQGAAGCTQGVIVLRFTKLLFISAYRRLTSGIYLEKMRISPQMFSIRRSLLVFLLLASSFSAHAQTSAPDGGLEIAFENDRLTLIAKNADLKTVLLRLSSLTRTDIRVPKALEKQVTLNLRGVTLAKAFKRILKGMNYAVVYSTAGKSRGIEVDKVLVYHESDRRYASHGPAPSNAQQARLARRIENYERRIETMKKNLVAVGADTPQGKQYARRIRNYTRAVERLRQRMR